MLWEIEIRPRGHDSERARVAEEYDLLTHSHSGSALLNSTAYGYLVEGDLDRSGAQRLLDEVLLDPVAQLGRLGALNEGLAPDTLATVLLRPGVMDPAALSIAE